jgi:hypothetical protein
LTFKDLHKRVSSGLQTTQDYKTLERLRDKPFWIWNISEHKEEDIKTNGDCCFNHIIGLPQKYGNDKPLYDYEGIIFDETRILYLVVHMKDRENCIGQKE